MTDGIRDAGFILDAQNSSPLRSRALAADMQPAIRRCAVADELQSRAGVTQAG